MYKNLSNDPVSRANISYSWTYWDNAFTENELDHIVSYCEQFDKSFATTFGSKDEEEIRKHRVSDVHFFERNNETSWMFERINHIIEQMNETYYNFDLNGYKSFQYTTYDATKKGRYDWHTDLGFDMDHGESSMVRKLSMTLCLNDDYEGGEFYINKGKQEEPQLCQSKKGRAILFPSFMIHRVAPVTKGIRRSIVVWVVGPKFR